MSSELRIDINRTGAGVEFDPDPRPANKGDQVFWRNNDTVAHWPVLRRKNGTINKTFFIPNQVAPNSSSDGFSPTVAGPIEYICFLHEDEQGTIEVT